MIKFEKTQSESAKSDRNVRFMTKFEKTRRHGMVRVRSDRTPQMKQTS